MRVSQGVIQFDGFAGSRLGPPGGFSRRYGTHSQRKIIVAMGDPRIGGSIGWIKPNSLLKQRQSFVVSIQTTPVQLVPTFEVSLISIGIDGWDTRQLIFFARCKFGLNFLD